MDRRQLSAAGGGLVVVPNSPRRGEGVNARVSRRSVLRGFAIVAALPVLAACAAPVAPTATPAPPKPAAPAPAAAPVPHAAGTDHAAKPKRLETVIEIDLKEMSFNSTDGRTNPTFRVPAGKTVGLHIHNGGAVMHELAIGRKPVKLAETTVGGTKVSVPAGYATMLFEEVESDLFFYYGNGKVEVEGARFEEMEVDPGIQDTWLRIQIPREMAGEWELGCFAAGHYEAGMHATLIVE